MQVLTAGCQQAAKQPKTPRASVGARTPSRPGSKSSNKKPQPSRIEVHTLSTLHLSETRRIPADARSWVSRSRVCARADNLPPLTWQVAFLER